MCCSRASPAAAIGGAHVARQSACRKGDCARHGGHELRRLPDRRTARLRFSSEFEIEFGLPVVVPTVSTQTIGAGGGSIGWIDPGGFLQVGPQSAGADPGPACYGRDGSGRHADRRQRRARPAQPGVLPGRRDPARSRTQPPGAATGWASGSALDPVEVASSMVRIANENMANAIRIVTVEQGIDPREYALIAMGGAGPTHAAEIAAWDWHRAGDRPPHPGLAPPSARWRRAFASTRCGAST